MNDDMALVLAERSPQLASGPVHVAVELVALELQLVDAVLDHVADADDADQPTVVDDRARAGPGARS